MPDETAEPPLESVATPPGNAGVESAADPDSSGQVAVALRETAAPETKDPKMYHEAAAPDAAAGMGAAPWQVPERPEAAPADATPWPSDEPPQAATGPGAGGADAGAVAPAPTPADWRQLADEVRRLSVQIAHGRA